MKGISIMIKSKWIYNQFWCSDELGLSSIYLESIVEQQGESNKDTTSN